MSNFKKQCAAFVICGGVALLIAGSVELSRNPGNSAYLAMTIIGALITGACGVVGICCCCCIACASAAICRRDAAGDDSPGALYGASSHGQKGASASI